MPDQQVRDWTAPHYPLQLLPYCRWHEGQTAELVGACDIVDDTIYRPHHAVNVMPTGLPGLHQGFEAGLQLIHVIHRLSFDLLMQSFHASAYRFEDIAQR
jgi:hypothetical protein